MPRIMPLMKKRSSFPPTPRQSMICPAGTYGREREQSLFEQIEAARKTENRGNIQVQKAAKNAMTTVIQDNKTMVKKIASNIYSLVRDNCPALSLDDLISSGNEGMLKAIEKFDLSRGLRFGTYAKWWVFSQVMEEIKNNSGSVHIPDNIRKQIKKLSRELGYIQGSDGPECDSFGEVKNMMKAAISLDQPMYRDDPGGAPLVESFAGNLSTPEELEMSFDSAKYARHLLSCLDEREQKIMSLYFGLEYSSYDSEASFSKIGISTGVDRRRVNQIIESALGKIRNSVDRIPAREKRPPILTESQPVTVPVVIKQEAKIIPIGKRERELAVAVRELMDRPGTLEERVSALSTWLWDKRTSTTDVVWICHFIAASRNGRCVEICSRPLIELLEKLSPPKLRTVKIRLEELKDQISPLAYLCINAAGKPRAAILSFIKGEGPAPRDYAVTISNEGGFMLVKIDNDNIILGELGCGKRKAIVRFRLENGEQIISVHELDGKTIREYRVIRSDKNRWAAVPLEYSRRYQSSVRGRVIYDWLINNGELPGKYTVQIKEDGTFSLLGFKECEIVLTTLKSKNGQAELRFRADKGEKTVSAHELDGTLIREFRLGKNADNKWEAVPSEISERNKAKLRWQAINDFIYCGGEIPKECIMNIQKTGGLILFIKKDTKIRMSALGCVKRPAKVGFRVADGEKIVSLNEMDGSLIREFKLVKTGENKWEALPLEHTENQKIRLQGRSILDFITGKSGPPPEIEMITYRGVIRLFELNNKRIILYGFDPVEDRPVKIRFKAVNGEKFVSAHAADGTLIKEFKFVLDRSGAIRAVSQSA